MLKLKTTVEWKIDLSLVISIISLVVSFLT
jgi:hypothetical protein